jgi:hypothetical protein
MPIVSVYKLFQLLRVLKITNKRLGLDITEAANLVRKYAPNSERNYIRRN